MFESNFNAAYPHRVEEFKQWCKVRGITGTRLTNPDTNEVERYFYSTDVITFLREGIA